jgi:hypothetical protein
MRFVVAGTPNAQHLLAGAGGHYRALAGTGGRWRKFVVSICRKLLEWKNFPCPIEKLCNICAQTKNQLYSFEILSRSKLFLRTVNYLCNPLRIYYIAVEL